LELALPQVADFITGRIVTRLVLVALGPSLPSWSAGLGVYNHKA